MLSAMLRIKHVGAAAMVAAVLSCAALPTVAFKVTDLACLPFEGNADDAYALGVSKPTEGQTNHCVDAGNHTVAMALQCDANATAAYQLSCSEGNAKNGIKKDGGSKCVKTCARISAVCVCLGLHVCAGSHSLRAQGLVRAGYWGVAQAPCTCSHARAATAPHSQCASTAHRRRLFCVPTGREKL